MKSTTQDAEEDADANAGNTSHGSISESEPEPESESESSHVLALFSAIVWTDWNADDWNAWNADGWWQQQQGLTQRHNQLCGSRPRQHPQRARSSYARLFDGAQCK